MARSDNKHAVAGHATTVSPRVWACVRDDDVNIRSRPNRYRPLRNRGLLKLPDEAGLYAGTANMHWFAAAAGLSATAAWEKKERNTVDDVANVIHPASEANEFLKAHSHRARLRPSTSVDACIRASTDVDALGVNAQVF